MLRTLLLSPYLRGKIVIGLGVLALVRLMANLPLPGRPPGFQSLFQQDPFLALLDVFAGGATSRFSILALGLYPFLLARLLMPLVLPKLYGEAVSYPHSNDAVKWERLVYLCTAATAIVMAGALLYFPALFGIGLQLDVLSAAAMVATLTAGTMLCLWFGDRLGGQGWKWLIVANVLAALPHYLLNNAQSALDLAIRLLATVLVAGAYLVLSQGARRVTVSSPGVERMKRLHARLGRPLDRASQPHLPILFNLSGLTPLFYLLTLLGIMHVGSLLFQEADAGWIRTLARIEGELTDTSSTTFWLILFLLGIPFKLAFGAARFKGLDLARQLQMGGGSIPGIRPGSATDQYLRRIFYRLAWPEAILTMALVTVPAIVYYAFGLTEIWPIMLIPAMYVTGPIVDLTQLLQAYGYLHDYEPLIK